MQAIISFWAYMLRTVYNNITQAILAKVHLSYGSIRESSLLNLNVPENKKKSKYKINGLWYLK